MMSNVVLVPVPQFGPDLDALVQTLDRVEAAQSLRESTAHPLIAALVQSKVKPSTSLGKQLEGVLRRGTSHPVLKARTSDRVSWGESITAGVGVTIYAPKDSAAGEARAIVDELLELACGESENSTMEVAHG
jgi:cellulose biosynthesis protein BcsQ